MKKIIVSFLLSGAVCNAVFCQNDVNRIDKKGYKQGVWIKKYRSGRTYYMGEFKDNHEVGEFLYYEPNGNLKTRNTFSNEGSRCISEGFFESGKLMYRGIYLNKQKDSIWTYFHEHTGRKIMEERYAKGERTGTWYVFNENGDTLEYVSWKNDKKNGPWYRIYESGYVQGSYKNSELDSVYKDFYYDGKLREKGYYKEGKRTGGWDYYEQSGVKSRYDYWRDDEMKDRVLYIRNGEILNPVSIFDIAYFYKQGEGTVIVTSQGEKYVWEKPFEFVQALTGEEIFILLNQKQMTAVQYNALKSAVYDHHYNVVSVVIEPEPEISIQLDENGRKAVKAYFTIKIED